MASFQGAWLSERTNSAVEPLRNQFEPGLQPLLELDLARELRIRDAGDFESIGFRLAHVSRRHIVQ